MFHSLFFLNVYNWTFNDFFLQLRHHCCCYGWMYFLFYKAAHHSGKEYMLSIHLPMQQSLEFSWRLLHLSFMVHRPSIGPEVSFIATTGNGAQITDWFLRELCWMWYLASVSDPLSSLIPFVYVSEKKISFIPLLHKNPINFSSLLSLDKFCRHEIPATFIT